MLGSYGAQRKILNESAQLDGEKQRPVVARSEASPNTVTSCCYVLPALPDTLCGARILLMPDEIYDGLVLGRRRGQGIDGLHD